ncbi:PX-associated sorting nexin 13 [Penicillium concentricum]|uniref:PX-associated sorting nexin 13 n=1 Tax=Penicillium concentricum TaxID=293559 RepID=A0A9W9RRG3_9EURO|nr:PX-associated sorting nexin 13 [Penicillium concentricum]KAJ5365026.1 PX-associated sorting nexin 13 [Penicillium concentricum]
MSGLSDDDSQVISNKDHNTPPTHPVSNQVISKELIDATLNFLSTSTNETLLAVFALLALVTYIILGRIGLLLIGVAVGVVLHASWEGSDIEHADGASDAKKPHRRRELALEVSNRLLDWPKRSDASDIQGGGDISTLEDMSSADLEYATFQPATAVALRTLTNAVVKDYVKWWYEPLLPSESTFPGSCRKILTHFITSVSSHLSRKRTEDTFLQFLTNSSSIVIVFLNELAAAFTAAGSSPAEAQKAVDQYLENFPDSSLANVLSEKQQKKKLNMIADDILSNFLDAKTYNCPAVRDFLREVFAGVVLGSTVTSLARPEFINEWIIYLLQGGESEIMHAIDVGVEGARNQGVGAPRPSGDPNADSVKATHRESMHVARATEEEAVLEVKRLSAMIVSHDTQGSVPERPRQNEQIDGIGTLKADLASNTTHENEDHHDPGAVPNTQLPASPKLSQDSSVPPLILHGAQVLVDDDGARDEKGQIKSRPMWDYLLQVEPASTRSTGWMVFRKYSDFQSLHEMLGTVSRLNQISSFSERHPILPTWKGKTRQALARDLEWYLQDAMKHESLADTDRMHRFLEKDAGSSAELTSPNKPVFSFPSQTAFENMGKGVLGALTNAPKGVAGGGKAVFEGMTGVFGGAANSKKPAVAADQIQPKVDHSSRSSLSQTRSSFGDRNMVINENVDLPVCPSDSLEIQRRGISESPSIDSTRESFGNGKGAWTTETSPSKTSLDVSDHTAEPDVQAMETIDQTSSHRRSETGQSIDQTRKHGNPITADETQIAVELIFAVINELYTLSSAWNIRRTLLNAAKSYILRPGSPTLETIRTLLQESMIEGHTSDDALGDYLVKLRENALPTEEELKAWPAPPSEEEKIRLRDTARKLFVQRGIPQALTSVMGAAASREALEKIFDSLQVESVARGFVFSILLQGLRVLTL